MLYIGNSTLGKLPLLYLAGLTFLPSVTHSAESKAFNTLNLNPTSQIFGLPSLDNRLIGKQGSATVELEQQVANYYSRSNLASEALILDGETWRTRLNVSYAMTDQSQLSIAIPYLRHSAGYADNLIYRWHELLNLPQGIRTRASNDQFNIRYTRDNQTIISRRASTSGVGDIRLKYAHALPLSERDLTLQSEIKLPTGDLDRLTGSEGIDLSAGLMLNDPVTASNQNITYWYGGAVTYLASTKSPLSTYQNNWVFSGKAGAAWDLTESITLKTQLDSHTAVYDSAAEALGDSALMLTLGGDIHLSPAYRLELSVVEDLITVTSPDIIFTAKLSVKIQ